MKYLGNAFSIQMLKGDCKVSFEQIKKSEVPEEVISFVGHADTAAVLTNLLGFNIPVNRVNLVLEKK